MRHGRLVVHGQLHDDEHTDKISPLYARVRGRRQGVGQKPTLVKFGVLRLEYLHAACAAATQYFASAVINRSTIKAKPVNDAAPLPFSLFELLRASLGDTVPTTRLTKATLVHVSHTLEDVVLRHQRPALLFVGFQESGHWREESARYEALTESTAQVYIFAGKPLTPESNAKALHIELGDEDPLRQEWFLLILSDTFAVLLCGQDQQADVNDVNDEDMRYFDTLWTFAPGPINHALDRIETVIQHYRPDRLAALQDARQRLPVPQPDTTLISHITLEIIRYEETLNAQLQQVNRALKRQHDVNDLMVNLLPAFVVAVDGGGLLRRINHHLLDALQVPPEQMIGQRYDAHPRLAQALDGLKPMFTMPHLALVEPFQWEDTLLTNTGRSIDVTWQASSIIGSSDTLIMAVGMDMSDYSRIQAQLAENEAWLRQIMTSINSYIYAIEIDADGQVYKSFSSPQLKNLSGHDPEDTLNNPDYWPNHIIHPDDRALAADVMDRLRRGEGVTSSYRIQTIDGAVRWVRDTAQPVRNPINGHVTVYGVIDDITQQREAEKQHMEQERLRLALGQEREMNRLKNELMTMLSHEFRTPLATILTATDMLIRYDEKLDTPKRTERLERIQAQVGRLRSMLDDINTIIQISTGKLRMHREATDLTLLAQAVIIEAQSMTGSERTITLETDGPIQGATIDPRLVKQMLINLLTNAILYTPTGTPITLRLSVSGDTLHMVVRDEGAGIPETEQAHIFEAFYRGENATHITGTGLGLKIVADYVEQHRGVIRCESTPGEGTTFTLSLPLTPTV